MVHFIFYTYTLSKPLVPLGRGIGSSGHWPEGRKHLGQVASLLQGRHTDIYTPRGNLIVQ